MSLATKAAQAAYGLAKSAVNAINNLPVAFFTPNVTYLSSYEWDDYTRSILGYDPQTISPAQMWHSQPHLRTVVSFLAENYAQLGLHVFRRTSDGGRARDRDSVLAQACLQPGEDTTMYDSCTRRQGISCSMTRRTGCS